MQIKWTKLALQSFKNELTCIAEENPKVAIEIKIAILDKIDLLKDTPFMGVKYISKDIRKLIVVNYPFSIYYRVKGQKIEILRIRHQARNPTENYH